MEYRQSSGSRAKMARKARAKRPEKETARISRLCKNICTEMERKRRWWRRRGFVRMYDNGKATCVTQSRMAHECILLVHTALSLSLSLAIFLSKLRAASRTCQFCMLRSRRCAKISAGRNWVKCVRGRLFFVFFRDIFVAKLSRDPALKMGHRQSGNGKERQGQM
jgi:hypothetical protein